MLRVLSLFSGIGAFEVALDEENIEWELDHYCEIDKYACQSYNCIHGTTDEDNLKDVTNIDYSKIGNVDLVTYGFPCQDISLAGKGKGFFDEEGNLTRSGLFFNAADIIRHTKPKFAIFENVKNLTGKKFKNEFETVLSTLDELGYNTYWKVLNAKDYGIPQNRERVFGISIRKDIDHGYEFPLPVELTLRLKDMLESEVDEKYYMDNDKLEKMDKWRSFQNPLNGVLSKNDISPTITTRIAISDNGGINASTKLYSIDLNKCTNLRNRLYRDKKIRYYTEIECWKLMGFNELQFDKAKSSLEGLNLTENQLRGCLYKQAGNSIVVDVIKCIFEELYNQYPEYFSKDEWGSDL